MIDFKKVFDRVWHAGLWPVQVIRSFNIEEGLVQAIQAQYENSSNADLSNSQPGDSSRRQYVSARFAYSHPACSTSL